jgi:glycosyltransferase involved in cell wall biosynthesis
MNRPLMSFICATKNRYDDVNRLVQSLAAQSDREFELIVVDQSDDDRLAPLLSDVTAFPLHHIRTREFANTRARNIGLQSAKGEWVAFPDDDCWYHTQVVSDVRTAIASAPGYNGIFINWEDPDRRVTMFNFAAGEMGRTEPFDLASCICLFLKRESVLEVKGFNERLGLGAGTVIKAGEEQELMLRMLHRNMRIMKKPDIVVYHAIRPREWNDEFAERIKGQGACDVFFRRKYIGYFAGWKLLARWTAAFFFNLLRFNKKNALWYYYKLSGGINSSSQIER